MARTDPIGTSIPRDRILAAFRVSAISVAWTLVTSSIAEVLGIRYHTVVLVALGAVGFVDAIGSFTLAVHFRDALHSEELSERLERIAHVVVLACLAVVGSAAIVVGAIRLARGESGGDSTAGVVLAAVSAVVLTVLSRLKGRIARAVQSPALRSDGHLSGIGAAQAMVALLGTAATGILGWSSADAVATTCVGIVAVSVAAYSWREHTLTP